MSFSKIILMATTTATIMLILSTSTASARTLNDGDGGGETKKIEDMSLIPAPEVERGMKGYWNKWKLAVEGFHFPHLHFPHIPNISFSIPISIPFPPFHIHDLHLDQPSSLATSAQPPAPSAQPPAYILN
ncbi:uncharacterized protein LOC107421691 [Ziziphus jujuba]|uniref:Uncharacterized protein LOC107421691 n=1 Tax=Ziziphus jujuba TaxID=326968 RepID=A0A6P4AE00_ZIZJJ|nr:uncharacterized protein LOC107421691 [Ziziphus jujuba]